MSKKTNKSLDLRVEPDQLVKMLPNLSIVTWCLGAVSVLIALLTLPWVKSFLNLAFNLTLRPQLDLPMLGIDFYLMITTFIFSMIGIGIQSKRCRRRKDRTYSSFTIFGALSLLMMAGYLAYTWWFR